MRPRVNWSFADACARAASVDDVCALFMREMEGLGFTHLACASHVDPLSPPPGAVMMVRYPQVWLERFSACDYAKVDPVFATARRQLAPFQWSSREFRRTLSLPQLRILAEAREFGLGEGLTVPIHSPDAPPASCSMVIGPDGIDPLSVERAHWHAIFAYEAARRIANPRQRAPEAPRLSTREKECLEWVARGKDDYAIGAILGVQERTAQHTVQRAMHKFKVGTRVQAIMRAMRAGEIRIEDVAD